MNKVIVFIQASRDIVFALSYFREVRSKITYLVIDHDHNYNVLTSLIGKENVLFIKNRKVRGPASSVIERIRLTNIHREQFSGLQSSEVYFFSNYFDFKTFYFLSKLEKKNKIIMLDHYQLKKEIDNKESIYTIVKKLILWIATGIWFHLSKSEKCAVYNIDSIKKISLDINHIKCNPFVFPSVSSKSAILFDSNEEESPLYYNYSLVINRIINILLEQGFSIYVKPHPRLGMSKIFNEYPIEVLDKNIPIEVIRTDDFKLAIGNISAALGGCSPKVKVLSILNLIHCDKKISKVDYTNYLKKICPRVEFIEEESRILELCQNGDMNG